MTIWAIADIHASPVSEEGVPEKPMDVFGPNWADHVDRIESAWRRLVQPADTVLVVGDLDWSLHLEDAVPTLIRLESWPGAKLLVRGNHDYWWSSKATSRVRRVLPPSIRLLHNDSVVVEGFNIVGSKGSSLPGGPEWTDTDAKLLNRETERLKLSLAARQPDLPTLGALHYPPFYPQQHGSPYVDLLHQAGTVACVYGHLHGDGAAAGPKGEFDGILYVLVAADYVGFQPVRVAGDGQLIARQALI